MKTTNNRHAPYMMKRALIISILILNAITLAAIKPNRVYSYTPDKLDLTYEEFKVKTDDGFTLNVWHLPSEGEGTPVIISQSDAGNMGDWLYLGLYLQAYGQIRRRGTAGLQPMERP